MAAAPPEVPTTAASLFELRDIAIAREPDRYLAATLAPATLRYDLVVLAAFAAEIARIPEQVREPLAGEIRLQWWRDALAEDGAEAAAGHPVAAAMRQTIAKFKLPGAIIEGVIDAQADVLYRNPPADEAALRARMAQGEGGLFQLAARVSTPDEIVDDARTAGLAGLAYGLSSALVRGRSNDTARLLIPELMVADDAIAPEPYGEPVLDARLAPAINALAAMARAAHADVAVRLRQMSRRRRLAFLPLAMVKPNLRVLERVMTQREPRPSEPQLIARLLRIGWAHARGRF